jgi:hypothetical protein
MASIETKPWAGGPENGVCFLEEDTYFHSFYSFMFFPRPYQSCVQRVPWDSCRPKAAHNTLKCVSVRWYVCVGRSAMYRKNLNVILDMQWTLSNVGVRSIEKGELGKSALEKNSAWWFRDGRGEGGLMKFYVGTCGCVHLNTNTHTHTYIRVQKCHETCCVCTISMLQQWYINTVSNKYRQCKYKCSNESPSLSIVAVEKKSNKYYILWVCVCSLSYPPYNAHAPCYIVACGLSGSTIFFYITS